MRHREPAVGTRPAIRPEHLGSDHLRKGRRCARERKELPPCKLRQALTSRLPAVNAYP